MKRYVYLSFLLLLAQFVGAQVLAPDDHASSVTFKVKNLGVNTGGRISGLKGKIVFNAANPLNGSFEASAELSTLNTGIDMRDDHLKKEEYFDLGNFPQIQLVSERVGGSNKKDTWFFYGKLTIKGVTQAISFPFTAVAEAGGYRFNGSFKINRRDFKVGGKSLTLSDEVTVTLSVLAK